MFGLDLTLGQKLQIAFVTLVLGIAAFLVYRGTRPGADATITSWVESRKIGLDPKLPISAKNPADPAKTLVVTIFACHDGHLEITEYPDGPDGPSDRKASFIFVPDLKRKSYDFYKDPMEKIYSITDPYKHALSLAAYTVALGRPSLGLLGKVGLSGDQLKAERELRDKMQNDVLLLNERSKTGNFQTEMYENVLRAVNAYRAKEGDPTKNAAKAALARKVIDRTMEYLERLHKEQSVVVQQYIDGIDALLQPDQKTKLAEAGKNIKNPNPKPTRARLGG